MNTTPRFVVRALGRTGAAGCLRTCGVLLAFACGAFLVSCENDATPPVPPPPPKPPVDYAANFELYGKHLRLEHKAAVPKLAEGVLNPILLVKLTNAGPLPINHLKLAASVILPDLYSEKVEIAPFSTEENRGKMLPPGKSLTFQIQFKAKSLADPKEATRMIEAGQAQYNVQIQEVNWPSFQLNFAQAVALYAPHFGFTKDSGFAPGEVKDGMLAPTVRIGLVNAGPLNINHLKFVLLIEVDDYKDQVEISPFADVPQLRGKVLPAKGGNLPFRFQFKPKKVENAEDIQKKINDGKAKLGLKLTEVNFAG